MTSYNVRSSSVKGSLLFNTKRIKSASLNALRERSTPIFSTISSVSRIPAVSTSLNGTPRTLTYSSNTSRVVPATSVTMALLSWIRLFSIEDLPTFGLPTITVDNPSLIILPWVPVSNNWSISFLIFLDCASKNSVVASSTSSYSG